MVLQLAEDYVRPVWPPVTGHQRRMMHLDVQVDDLDAAVADASHGRMCSRTPEPVAIARLLLDIMDGWYRSAPM